VTDDTTVEPVVRSRSVGSDVLVARRGAAGVPPVSSGSRWRRGSRKLVAGASRARTTRQEPATPAPDRPAPFITADAQSLEAPRAVRDLRARGFYIVKNNGFLPWSSDQLARLIVADAIALGLIAGGWYGTSGEGLPQHQLPWVAMALGGLVLGGVANALWLLKGRHLVGISRVNLLPSGLVESLRVRRAGGGTGVRGHLDAVLVSAPGMQHFHRAWCPLAAGKPCTDATRAEHERSGLRPCGVCEP
jgi:hypothetical protein